MEIVKTIKRIIALDKADKRIPVKKSLEDDTLFAIWGSIVDKRELLSNNLKSYINAPDDRRERYIRRKCVKLACKLLSVDYYRVIR